MEIFDIKAPNSEGLNPFRLKISALAYLYDDPAEAHAALYEFSERMRTHICAQIPAERIMTVIFGTLQFYKSLNIYEDNDTEALSQRIQENDVRYAMFEIIMHGIIKHQYYHGSETVKKLKKDLHTYMKTLEECMNEPEVTLVQTTEGLQVHDNLHSWLKKIDD